MAACASRLYGGSEEKTRRQSYTANAEAMDLGTEKAGFNKNILFVFLSVSRECNFDMPLTSFTIGGFTQPLTAANINCQSGSAEKGLSSRFLWISPSPVFKAMDDLEAVDETFCNDYGKC